MTITATPEDRVIQFGEGLAALPERLLLAHARGDVLFICGAGISMPAGLPDFRQLTLDVYRELDAPTYSVLAQIPSGACNKFTVETSGLNDSQIAEVRRFIAGDYDVVLGMLERRLDNDTRADSHVRKSVADSLRSRATKPAPIHRALLRLADRGNARTIITTNFDQLLEVAAQRLRAPVKNSSLGSIPRPSRRPDFSGVLHIHGTISKNTTNISDFVLSDRDFGEHYLRRRTIPDFIHDAARLYNLVLVGYSANDPPMRYLLNSVAADGTRFDDLKERFTFISAPDHVSLQDWRGRGITPIQYVAKDDHSALRATLERWAALSPINGKKELVDSEIRRIVRKIRSLAEVSDKDVFDHFFRRSNTSERVRLSSLVSEEKADIQWLDAIMTICKEPEQRQKL